MVCQLDHLCELPSDRARREALATLPPTLTATYERILIRINGYSESIRVLVQNSLLLIASRNFNLTTRMICEAASVSATTTTLNDDEIVEEEEILRWCGSFVRRSSGIGQIEFAHFTVREFLQDGCTQHPELDRYSASDDKAYTYLGLTCLRYVNLGNFGNPKPQALPPTIEHIKRRVQVRPFYEYAATKWPPFFHGQALSETDASVSLLLYDLFDLEKRAKFCAWTLEVIRHCLVSDQDKFDFASREDFGRSTDLGLSCIEAVLRPDFTSLHMAAALALPNLCARLLRMGARANLRSRFGTPLQFAIGGLMVLSDKSDTFERLSEGLSTYGSGAARQATVQLLLNAGASTDLTFHNPFRSSSALELAIGNVRLKKDVEVVVDLINAGIPVKEDDDLKAFEDFYHWAKPNSLREQRSFENDTVIERLMSALEKRAGEGESGCQQFLLTLQSASASLTRDSTNEYEVDQLLSSIIRQNDVAKLEQLFQSDLSESIKTILLDGRRKGRWQTPLHLAVLGGSLDVLKALLEVGCDPNIISDDGRTPVHLCFRDWDADALKVLLEHGASSLVRTLEGETIWHLCAKENSPKILKMLMEIGDTDEALEQQSHYNETPICAGLSCRSLESVLVLLSHCNSKAAWKSSLSLFRNAARLGSSAVLEKLLEVGVEIDGLDEATGSPLHFLGLATSVECISILEPFFDITQRPAKHGRSPFEQFLLRALERPDLAHSDTCKALLPSSTSISPEEMLVIWHFMTCTALPMMLTSNYGHASYRWFLEILLYYLHLGIVGLYEARVKTPAFLPICHWLCAMTDRTQELMDVCDDEGHSLRRLEHWRLLSDIVLIILPETRFLNEALADPNILGLLQECIIHDDHRLLKVLLEAGVDVHLRVNKLSALELACFPYTLISDENFDRLLENVSPDQVMTGNLDYENCGPLHFTAGSRRMDGALSRLRSLLQLGISCDLPNSQDTGTPLLYHTELGSIETAQLLLKSGADPWLFCQSDGRYAALEAVTVSGGGSLLHTIVKMATGNGSNQKWNQTISLKVSDGKTRREVSALHLAAMFGKVEICEFLLEKGCFQNLDVMDDQGETPIHFAARFGHPQIIQILSERGGNIDAQSKVGLTALHVAASKGYLECVRSLIELGAKQLVCSQGCTPSIYGYEYPDIFQLLEAEGSTVLLQSPIMHPGSLRLLAEALYFAIRNDSLRMCQRAIASGCPIDVELDLEQRITPLMAAIVQPAGVEMVNWLIEKGSSVSIVYQQPYQGKYYTVLDAAIAQPNLSPILPLLLERFQHEGGNPLSLPCNLLCQALVSENLEAFDSLMDALKRWTGDLENPAWVSL